MNLLPADASGTWFGSLPKGWGVVPLRFMARFESGGTPDKSNQDFWGGEIPWVSPKDMKVDRIADSEDHITESALEETSLSQVPVGSVLLVVRGMILAHSIPVAVTTAPVTINQDMKALRCSGRVESRFLQAVIHGAKRWFLANTGESSHGTKKLETEVVGRFPVPLPPLDLQRAIADFLDAETARIDALIVAKENLLTILAEKRRALITQAVTRGLDPDAATRDSGIPWVGEVPLDWDVLNVGFAGEVLVGRQRTPRHQQGAHITPYLRVANVLDGFIDYSDVLKMNFEPEEQRRFMLSPGDILLNEGQSLELVGRSAIFRGPPSTYCFQNTLVRFRCRRFLMPGYAQYVFKMWLERGIFQLFAKQTTNIAHLGGNRFAQMPICIPPLAEQKAILEKLSRELLANRKIEKVASKTVLLLRERREAVIAAAVTGQLDVEAA